MRADRLLKLADFLETVPRKSFDLSLWVSSDPTKPEGKKQGECGFAGCAVGWAPHAKLFRGLKNHGYGNHISYRGENGFDAVNKLFDLTPAQSQFSPDDAHHLFSPRCYANDPTPKQVATRIRKFVKEHSEGGGR